MYRLPYLCLVLLLLASCYSTNPMRNLPAGSDKVAVSVGSYIYNDGLAAPNISLGYYNGITDWFTLGGNLQPQWLFNGTLVVEASGMFRVIKGEDAVPELTGALGTYYFLPFSDNYSVDNSFQPFFRINASSQLSEKVMVFVGSESMVRFDDPALIITPSLGVCMNAGNTMQVQLEAKLIGLAGISSQHSSDNILHWNDNAQIALFVGFFIGDLYKKHND